MFNLFEDKTIDNRLDFSFNEEDNAYSDLKRLSISGVQEKYSAIVENGKIKLVKDGEQGTYILKPVPFFPFQYRSQMPFNEYLTMQIANEVYGIKTSPCGICYTTDNKPVFITQRFDITDDGKMVMEDFASLIGKVSAKNDEQYKYEGSYQDIALVISRIVTEKETALCDFLKIVVFNYLFANGDAHLKNFSIINDHDRFALAPAYDLLNTRLHINDGDFALINGLGTSVEKTETYQHTGHPCKEDFKNFADSIGISSSKSEEIINQFTLYDDKITSFVEKSELQDKPKRIYKSIITERYKRFVRG